MRGCNRMVLNEATMIEALQEYFDKRMGVFSSEIGTIKHDKTADMFEIACYEKQPANPAQGE